MDAKLSRSQIVKIKDPHDWNSYDNYCFIHEKRLADHPFVDESRPNTLRFDFIQADGILFQHGHVYCRKPKVILDVGKVFETRYKTQKLQIRGVYYRYVAWVEDGNPILYNICVFDFV